jgi:hypothetical protein
MPEKVRTPPAGLGLLEPAFSRHVAAAVIDRRRKATSADPFGPACGELTESLQSETASDFEC